MGRVGAKNSNALLGALVSSALAAGAFAAPPPAHASCFSAFGFNNGNGCISNLTTIAIGIGDGATASATSGLFTSAIALGTNAHATTSLSAFMLALAAGDNAVSESLDSFLGWNLQFGPGTASTVGGLFNFVLGISPDGMTPNVTGAVGLGNIAVKIGAGTTQALGAFNVVLGLMSGNANTQSAGASGIANFVMQAGAGTAAAVGLLNAALSIVIKNSGLQTVSAGVLGTLALNFLGDGGTAATQAEFSSALNFLGTNIVTTAGILSTALNWLGTGNNISVTGLFPFATFGTALNFFGSDNVLKTVGGPLAIIASFFQEAGNVIQNGPGIRITGPFHLDLPSLAHQSAASVTRASATAVSDRSSKAAARTHSDDGGAAATPAAADDATDDVTVTAAVTPADDSTTTVAPRAARGGAHRISNAPSTTSDAGSKKTSGASASDDTKTAAASRSAGGKHPKH